MSDIKYTLALDKTFAEAREAMKISPRHKTIIGHLFMSTAFSIPSLGMTKKEMSECADMSMQAVAQVMRDLCEADLIEGHG